MRFKHNVRKSLSNIEMVYMNEATQMAELFDEGKISYDDLIQLREYFSMTRPEYYKILFEMIEECLLRIKLKDNEVESGLDGGL